MPTFFKIHTKKYWRLYSNFLRLMKNGRNGNLQKFRPNKKLMDKILLIKTYWPYPYGKGEHTYNRIWPPLSLALCASLLRESGFSPQILDAHALRINPQDITPYIQGFDKIFITSSSLDRWICPNINISPFLDTAEIIHKENNEFYIMGYHGSRHPHNFLKRTKAKAIILGEPEQTVVEICRNKRLSTIEGIAYLNDEHIHITKKRSSLNLKSMPIPAYDLLDTNKYNYEILGNNFTLFELTRGCNHRCKFCSKLMYGEKVRSKKIEQVIDEVETAVENNGVKNGYFIDLEFLTNKDLVNLLCDFLIKKKYDFQWCCQTRPDSLDYNVLRKMREANCKLIHLGIESGLQKYLDLMNKGIKLDKIKNCIKMCEDLKIKTLAFYVFGFKGETALNREEIFKFAKELNTDFISMHKAYPYEDNDIFLKNIKNEQEIDLFIRKKILKYYLRISYLKKLNILSALKCFKLFTGRIFSL